MSFHFHNPWEDPTSSSRLDLVFDHRFKLYGAYAIRRQYARNKIIAMLTAGFFTSALAAVFLIKRDPSPLVQKHYAPPYYPVDTVMPVFPDEKKHAPASGGGSGGGGSAGSPEIDNTFIPPVLRGFGTGHGHGGDSGSGPPDPWFKAREGEGPRGAGTQKQNGSGKVSSRACVFHRGDEAFIQYIKDNFVPPAECIAEASQGFARIRFMVNEKGFITDVQVLESSASCPGFREETIRVFKASPKWQAAIANGRFVRCWRETSVILEY